jgi:GT2 family glycosyltransferase
VETLAIIVNYKSANLTLRAVQSVLDSQSLGPVETVVVDNSEDGKEAENLRQGLHPLVRLRVNPENMGFGRACNQALEGFRGDAILLLNPDARLLPGCLLRLQETLFSRKRWGAASSHIFWDENLTFYLPSSYPCEFMGLQAVFQPWGVGSRVNKVLSALWRWHSINVWQSRGPIKVNNLSGSLALLKASAVQRAGGLFDPRFFLYFEDTDLFLRLRKAGFTLVVEPRAKAIHYYDQCASDNRDWKRACMIKSEKIFLGKHGAWRGPLERMAELFKGPVRVPPMVPAFTSPFVLGVPDHLHAGWLFEWSPNPSLIPSAARFGKGPWMDFPEKCWAMLAPGRYFGRLGGTSPFARSSRLMTWVVPDGEGS